MPVALVTGSSSGIGLATALHFARNGYRTYATMRDPSGADPAVAAAIAGGAPLVVARLDVDDQRSVDACMRDVLAAEGAIDVLVNNAGIGSGLAIAEAPDDEVRQIFETNFFGALRMIRAVVPSMRERRSGAIVNVTSMGGRVVMPTAGVYCASKFALEAASETLAIEVAPHGIRVAIIEPGVVLTPIFSKVRSQPPADTPYALARRRFLLPVGRLAAQWTPAQACADVILEAITTSTPHLRYPVGTEAHAILENRTKVSDEAWLAMFNIEDDGEYVSAIMPLFGEKGAPARP